MDFRVPHVRTIMAQSEQWCASNTRMYLRYNLHRQDRRKRFVFEPTTMFGNFCALTDRFRIIEQRIHRYTDLLYRRISNHSSNLPVANVYLVRFFFCAVELKILSKHRSIYLPRVQFTKRKKYTFNPMKFALCLILDAKNVSRCRNKAGKKIMDRAKA